VNFTYSQSVLWPVFYVSDQSLKDKIGRMTHVVVSEEFGRGDRSLAWFSSKGTSATGNLKPDVVAPGENIVNARSIPNPPPNHDLDPLKLQLMSGTSMATPNVAGSLALIEEYLRDQCGLTSRSSSLLKAVLINCADPIPTSLKYPNNDYGFGSVNLGKYLPLWNSESESSFRIVLSNSVTIAKSQHLESSIRVVGVTSKLRVTIASLDP
jgi:subtilisin family serine protease